LLLAFAPHDAAATPPATTTPTTLPTASTSTTPAPITTSGGSTLDDQPYTGLAGLSPIGAGVTPFAGPGLAAVGPAGLAAPHPAATGAGMAAGGGMVGMGAPHGTVGRGGERERLTTTNWRLAEDDSDLFATDDALDALDGGVLGTVAPEPRAQV